MLIILITFKPIIYFNKYITLRDKNIILRINI